LTKQQKKQTNEEIETAIRQIINDAIISFLPTHKAKQKNAKELPSQRTTTRQTMNETTTTDRRAACNSGFAKKRVQWLIEHSTSHQLLWCVDSFELRNPLLRKAAKIIEKLDAIY
jgi:hypothetical protein